MQQQLLCVQENKDEVLEGRGLAEEPQGIQKQSAEHWKTKPGIFRWRNGEACKGGNKKGGGIQ